MELSTNLLKQFASMTQNTNKEKETSKNVYGTIKATGDGKFVTIDGSDILTPVSEGTDVRDGDRVIVSIENHKATVFSNLSSPSSGRTATDLDPLIEGLDIRVNNLVASSITTEYLQANYASITSLAAESARIDKLISTSVTTDYLEANYADIDSLKAVEADITTLKANSITTEYLEANFAKVDLANIEAASIKTYMIGEGVVGEAQIADASITDAKIVEMTASKLTAGRIDAAEIEVVNLNAANITVGTINGQQIAPGAIDMSNLNADLSGTITDTAEDVQQALADALSAAAAAGAAQSTANSALTAANGKNKVFYQTTAPDTSGRVIGDTWFDTDDDNAIYQWDGSKWAAVSLGSSAIQNGAITADQIAKEVNDKLTNAFNNAAAAQTTAGAAQTAATNAQKAADTVKANAVYKTEVYYAQSTSTTQAPTSGWSVIAPPWEDGKYMWQKTVSTMGDGSVKESSPTCIAGANGRDGSQGINIFGFSKGIHNEPIGGTPVTPYGYLDESIKGVVINNINGGNPSIGVGGIFRLIPLGLGGIVGWYTVSGEIYATKNVDIGIDINDCKGGILNVTTTPKKFVMHIEVTKKGVELFNNGFLDIEGPNTGCPIYIKNLKIELGKVDNPIWTPALEDLQDSGVYYQNDAPAADGLRVNDVWFDTNDSNKMYSWSGSSWVQRQFGTNAIANASITNALIADAAINNAKIANLDAAKITTGTLNASRIGANTITADKINVGLGGNLYFNYDTFENITNDNIYHTKHSSVTPTIDTSTAYYGTKCLKLVRNSDTSNGFVRLGKPNPNTTGAIPTVPGKKYLASAYVKGSTNVSVNLYVDYCNQSKDWVSGFVQKINVNVGTEWTRVVCPVITGVKEKPYIMVDVGLNTPSATCWWDAIQIEEVPTDTSQPTPFKPAGGTIINGANILTSSITASSMVAGTITAASGIIADGAITNAKIQNGAIDNAKIANLDASKITTGTLNAARIGAKTITADKIVIGDFDNLSVIEPDTPTNPYNAVITTINNKKYFQFGNTSTSGYYSLLFRLFRNSTTFRVGDKYILKATAQSTNTVPLSFYLRQGYSDNTWVNIGIGDLVGGIPSTDTTISSVLTISNTVDRTKALSGDIRLFVEFPSRVGIVYMRDITIYKMSTSELIVDGAITTAKITAGAINADKLAANAVTAGKIAANAVTTSNLQASAVNADKLAANAVTAGKIAANAVTADNIVAGAITAGKIASKAVDATKMVAGTITAASGIIADAAITTAKIGDLQVTGAKIANLTVESGKIKDGAITTAKIGDAQITNAKIASLDASKITAGTINAARIGSNSITADKINITDLFSKNITATGTITGATITATKGDSYISLDGKNAKLVAKTSGEGAIIIQNNEFKSCSADNGTFTYVGISDRIWSDAGLITIDPGIDSPNVAKYGIVKMTVTGGSGFSGNGWLLRIGDIVILTGFYSNVSISSAYSWWPLGYAFLRDVGFTSASTIHTLGSYADVSGGGPMYADPIIGARVDYTGGANLGVSVDIQANKTFSSKYVRFHAVAIINH